MRWLVGDIEVLTPQQVKDSPFEGLKRILATEDPNKDLMYVRFVLCHEGPNDNRDLFFRDELEAAYETIRNKPINWEHELPIIGVVTDSILVKPEDDRWHVVCAGVVWRYLFPDQADAIRRGAMDRLVSISMECYYRSVIYVVGERFIPEEQAPELEEHVGRIYNGQMVYRGLKGVLFGGCGVVRRPADKEAVFLAVARRIDRGEDVAVAAFDVFPDWTVDFYEFLRFGGERKDRHMDTSTWGKTNFGHRLLHLWWRNPERTDWTRDEIIDEHMIVVRAMIEKYRRNHNMVDGLDETLPEYLKDKSNKKGANLLDKEGRHVEVVEIREIPDEELARNLETPDVQNEVAEVTVAEIRLADEPPAQENPTSAVDTEPGEEAVAEAPRDAVEQSGTGDEVTSEDTTEAEEQPDAEVGDGHEDRDNTDADALRTAPSEADLASKELEERYNNLLAAYESLQAEHIALKAEIERKEMEVKLDAVADERLRDLVASGLRFAKERTDKIRMKLRGMSEEEFTEYKAELLDVRYASGGGTQEDKEESPTSDDVVAALNPELDTASDLENPYEMLARDLVGISKPKNS